MVKLFTILALMLFAACATAPEGQNVDLSNRKSTLRRIAETVKQNGDVQAAAQLEAQIIELDNKDPKSFIALAKSVEKYGSARDVIDILRTGEELNPTSEEIKLELAKVLIEDNSPLQAQKKLDEITLNQTRDYFNLRGVAYDIQGNYTEAQKQYEIGLQKFQRDNLLLNNMALSKLLMRKYDEAIEILQELSSRNLDGKYSHNLALAYGLKGDTKKAKEILGRELTPEEINENLRIYKELR